MKTAKRSRPIPAPVSQPLSRTVQNVASKALQRALDSAGASATAVDPAQLRAQMQAVPTRAKLDVPAGNPSKVDLTARDHDGSRLRLRVADVLPYDNNPRHAVNEKYHELKEGLRAAGFTGSLPVTRRPDDAKYMLCMGHNTTLAALKELWSESRDPRFEWVECTFHAYRGETWILSGHLVENNNRGALSFWDNAGGFMRLKAAFEAERKSALSLRDFEAELPKHGLTVSKTLLALYAFAMSRLAALGPATAGLNSKSCESIRTRLNLVRRLAAMHGTEEEAYWREHVDSALRDCAAAYHEAEEFDPRQLCDRVESRTAAALGLSSATLQGMLALLAKDPALSIADLRNAVARTNERQRNATPDGRVVGGESVRTPVSGFGGDASESANDTDTPAHVSLQASRGGPRSEDNDEHQRPRDAGRSRAEAERPEASRADGIDEQHPLPELPDAIAACLTAALEFARATDVADCIHLNATLPLGYFVEVPELGGASLPEQSGTTRHARAAAAWWMLATLSGQFHEHCAQAIGESSNFVQSWRDEQRYVELETSVLGPAHPEQALDWILDSGDASGALLLDLLRLVRTARSDHAERFAARRTETV